MQTILTFLKDLSLNNNREWFDANRDRYKEAKVLFEHLTELLIAETAQIDPTVAGLEPKDCIFRIFRDTRFSHDKSPYKSNFGTYLARGGKKSGYAGYYLHLSPDECFVAGGCHAPMGDILKNIRLGILDDAATYREIISDKTFVDTFGAVQGEEVKSYPRGFDKNHPDIDLVKKKQYFMYHTLSEEQVVGENLVPTVLESFRAMKPLNDFLNDAISR